MDWVPGRTWGWLGPSGSLCNELFIHSFVVYWRLVVTAAFSTAGGSSAGATLSSLSFRFRPFLALRAERAFLSLFEAGVPGSA
jgi:hypothetical protein